MRKDKFMSQINYSHSHGGLTCSFNDYQLAEYTQNHRRAAGRLPVKHSVGPQRSWVLGPSLFFNREGELLQPEESMYAWLGNIYDGPGIATACKIQMPLSIDPLHSLYIGPEKTCATISCHACYLLALAAWHFITRKFSASLFFVLSQLRMGKHQERAKQQHSVSDLVRWEYTHPTSYPRQHTRSTQIYVAQAIFHWALTTQNRNPLLVISSYHF